MVYLERAHMYDDRNHLYKCGQEGKLFQSSISRRSIRFRFNGKKVVISQAWLQRTVLNWGNSLSSCGGFWEWERIHPNLHLSGNPLTIASSTWAHGMKSWSDMKCTLQFHRLQKLTRIWSPRPAFKAALRTFHELSSSSESTRPSSSNSSNSSITASWHWNEWAWMSTSCCMFRMHSNMSKLGTNVVQALAWLNPWILSYRVHTLPSSSQWEACDRLVTRTAFADQNGRSISIRPYTFRSHLPFHSWHPIQGKAMSSKTQRSKFCLDWV